MGKVKITDNTMQRFKLIAAIYLMLLKNNKVFLLRRFNTGWEDGTYTLIGGHVESNESIMEAVVREATEEAGINVTSENLKLFNVLNLKTTSERIELSFVTSFWNGEPKNNEPQKCDEANWFSLDNLPINLESGTKEVLRCYKESIIYNEVGFAK